MANGKHQRGIATCVLSGHAELTLKRIKAAAKSHKNIEAGTSKSEFKREKERDSGKEYPREKHMFKHTALLWRLHSTVPLETARPDCFLLSFAQTHLAACVSHTGFHASLVFPRAVISVIAIASPLQTGGRKFLSFMTTSQNGG